MEHNAVIKSDQYFNSKKYKDLVKDIRISPDQKAIHLAALREIFYQGYKYGNQYLKRKKQNK